MEIIEQQNIIKKKNIIFFFISVIIVINGFLMSCSKNFLIYIHILMMYETNFQINRISLNY